MRLSYLSTTLIPLGVLLAACQPTVQLTAPDKPIQINMNVEVKVKVERDVDQAIKNNPNIF